MPTLYDHQTARTRAAENPGVFTVRVPTHDGWKTYVVYAVDKTDARRVALNLCVREFHLTYTPDRLEILPAEGRYFRLRPTASHTDAMGEYCGYWERADGAEGGILYIDAELNVTDYDGAYELPADVAAELRAAGYGVSGL